MAERPRKLLVGSHVKYQGTDATVRFVGRVQFAPGVMVGLEFRRPVGKTDGVVDGKKYFLCPPKHGLFVRPAAISFDSAVTRASSRAGNSQSSPSRPTPRSSPSPRKSPTKDSPKLSAFVESSRPPPRERVLIEEDSYSGDAEEDEISAELTPDAADRSTFDPDYHVCHVRVGDRVQLAAATGLDSEATVLYVGYLGGSQGLWVGCELDVAAGNTSGTYEGVQYFACDHKYGTFLRPSVLHVLSSRRTSLGPVTPRHPLRSDEGQATTTTSTIPSPGSPPPSFARDSYMWRVEHNVALSDARLAELAQAVEIKEEAKRRARLAELEAETERQRIIAETRAKEHQEREAAEQARLVALREAEEARLAAEALANIEPPPDPGMLTKIDDFDTLLITVVHSVENLRDVCESTDRGGFVETARRVRNSLMELSNLSQEVVDHEHAADRIFQEYTASLLTHVQSALHVGAKLLQISDAAIKGRVTVEIWDDIVDEFLHVISSLFSEKGIERCRDELQRMAHAHAHGHGSADESSR